MPRYTDIEPFADCRIVANKEDNGVLCGDLPIEVDVVKVVRCKNCIFREDFGPSGIYCRHPDNRNPLGCRPDDFCNDGMEGPEMTEAELLEWEEALKNDQNIL